METILLGQDGGILAKFFFFSFFFFSFLFFSFLLFNFLFCDPMDGDKVEFHKHAKMNETNIPSSSPISELGQ